MPVVVACGRIAIRHELLLFWMTSCFRVMTNTFLMTTSALGHGLTANPRLQFCGGLGSLASIHELTRTENFGICTPPLSVAGLVIFTKVAKIGGFFKFTALPLQDQTMHANESCHFCSSCALVLKTAETLEYIV